MLRIVIRVSSSRGCISSYRKMNSKSFCSLNSKFPGGAKAHIISSRFKIVQARFCSSNSIGTTVHKTLVVEAASPAATDVTSPTTDSLVTDENAMSNTVEYVPPPPLPELLEEPIQILNAIGEPTFQSLGLAGWSPIGLMQAGLEYIHVSVGLPWWGSIALVTIIFRSVLFPLVIITQRRTAVMTNHMPAIQRLQARMTEARSSGNEMEAARIGFELQQYMKKHDINPLRTALMPFVQAPIFISMFIGLRRCANLPVESFKTGGMFWFADLTVSDPYFILPMITSLTMLATIELGVEGQKLSQQSSPLFKYGFRAIPLVMFPFVLYFPSAVLCYWTSTNFFSLLQVGFLKIPAVRQYFKIDSLIKPTKSNLPKKGFVESIQDSWSNMKVGTDIAERERMTQVQFQKAGTGPLVKTYKHNPLKKSVINVKAKMKDQ